MGNLCPQGTNSNAKGPNFGESSSLIPKKVDTPQSSNNHSAPSQQQQQQNKQNSKPGAYQSQGNPTSSNNGANNINSGNNANSKPGSAPGTNPGGQNPQAQQQQQIQMQQQQQQEDEKSLLLKKVLHKKLNLSSFQQIRKLGKGAFGFVQLVSFTEKPGQNQSLQQSQQSSGTSNSGNSQALGEHAHNPNEVYAMKCINKESLVKLNLIEATLLERNLMKQNRHPFLVELKYSFQTESKVYFVMEYVQGGDLYALLRRMSKFTEDQARFIFAEVVSGIEYLHRTKIIYRDLKPENILITSTGHIKISDFGLSKQFVNVSDKTYTFAGTPEYLAPEIVCGEGHNKDVDLWSLGIFLYELLHGQPPFTDKQRNFQTIQRLIMENNVRIPEHFSEPARDLISKLLKRKPAERLGSANMQDLKQPELFGKKIDWEQLNALQVESPLKHLINSKEQNMQHSRPRQIYETPVQPGIKLPNISGISYNPDLAVQYEGF